MISVSLCSKLYTAFTRPTMVIATAGLARDYKGDKKLKLSFFGKLFVVVPGIIAIIILGSFMGVCSNRTPPGGSDYTYCNNYDSAAASLEWFVAALFCVYILTMIFDMYPSRYTSTHRRGGTQPRELIQPTKSAPWHCPQACCKRCTSQWFCSQWYHGSWSNSAYCRQQHGLIMALQQEQVIWCITGMMWGQVAVQHDVACSACRQSNAHGHLISHIQQGCLDSLWCRSARLVCRSYVQFCHQFCCGLMKGRCI